MKRRTALEYISLGLGYSLATPSLLSVIQACSGSETGEQSNTFQPAFFDSGELAMVEEMADILLPKTDTPGAKDLNLGPVMDSYVAQVYKKQDQDRFRAGMAQFVERLKAEQNAEPASATREQLTSMMQKLATEADEARLEDMESLVGKKPEEVSQDKMQDYQFYSFVFGYRSLAIAAYFGSELIGEKELNYAPIPGPFQGCIPLEEGQKNWSLG